MGKFSKLFLLVTLVLLALWSTPLAFLEGASAFEQQVQFDLFYSPGQYEEPPGEIRLEFHGKLVSPGSCQQIAANLIRCTVFVGQESVVELRATVTPSRAVNISAVTLPPNSSFVPASGWGTVTATWSFRPTTPGMSYEASFQAWTAGVPPVELSTIFDVVLPKLPKIEVSPTSLDFGEVPVGTTVEREVMIKNIGEAELWIGAVTIKGGAKSPFDLCGKIWSAYPLPPGGSVKLTVCFSPKTGGLFKDELTISSNDPTKPTVAIPVQGSAAKKKNTISCTAMGRPKPASLVLVHENVREAEVIVAVEISPSRSVEYTVKITDANGGTHGPFTYKTDVNGKAKRLVIVPGKLRNGKLEGTWKCEVGWKGDAEYEGTSSQCEFRVSELGSYEGVEAGPTTTDPTRPSNRININHNGFCTANCNKIVFIQVVTRRAEFTDGTIQPLKPTDMNANWTNQDNDTVTVGGQLFTVDYLNGENDPYYNGDDAQDSGAQGKHDADIARATMNDAPYTNAFDRIKGIYGKEVKKIIREFETFAFCVDGPDKGKFYQGINWRYEREKGEAGDGKSTIVGVVSEPSQGFKQALDKWCTNHGFTLPK